MSQHTCPSWISFSLDNSLRKIFHDPVAIVRDYIRPGNSVMDLGCGPGYFTIPMAQLSGETGMVIAVDIQMKMLEKMRRMAERFGLQDRIKAVQCRPDDIMVSDNVDFALAFWMVHEVGDKQSFLKQIASVMKKGSRFLMVEPKIHVTKKKYLATIAMAESAGLKPEREPAVSLSRTMLFLKS